MKNGQFKFKIYIIIFIGLIIVGLLYKFNTYTQYYFLENNKIQKQLNNIRNEELQLRYEVLITSIYMYTNNDNLIDVTRKLTESLNELLTNPYFIIQYPKIYKKAILYNKMIRKKINLVYEFETLNAPIKNSVMYLAYLLDKLPRISKKRIKNTPTLKNFKQNNEYAKKMIDIISSIFLARSSFDKDFIKNLHYEYFKNFKSNDKEFNRFNKIFVANLEVFIHYFDKYTSILREISDKKPEILLEQIHEEHLKQVNDKIIIIKIVSFSLMLFVLISVITVAYLIYKLQKDYEQLQILNKKLHYAFITDKLTGLFNRNKFDEDVKKLQSPVLILVNIDKFKNINDYYGIKIGDDVLKKTALILKKIFPKKLYATFYRLGADDFGILFEKNKRVNLDKLAKWIINNFEKKEIDIAGIKLHLSVSLGISMKKPYIENADIALKKVKKSHRHKYMIINDDEEYKREIKINIEKTNILYRAIKEERIEPYFQPIVDTKTKRIFKYEVLARIVNGNNSQSIYPYLQIAKDNKLYAEITQIMLKKTYEKIKNNDISFSINLSIEDILDKNILDLIKKLYLHNSLAKRTTFEILESEAVNDYEEIRNFIKEIKKHSSSVAIDDFGSGYSNFEHLINLNIDYIKIDGSLIKNIHQNENSYKVVKVIADFAKNLNIKTVAEFVASKEIYEKIKEIGIDYSQGFYFYKPEPFFIE